MSFRVVPVPCLSDNYAYLVICERSGLAAVVDPGEAKPVRDALKAERVRLSAVWATHHHPDHIGGVSELVYDSETIEVVAHTKDEARVPRANKIVGDGDEVTVGEVRARIIHNPGHTLGGISYHLEGRGRMPGAVFTGDTLFAAGCGRLFEGDAEMMRASLTRLTALPPETRVYFGHEYTAANLRFAGAVEPDSQAISERAAKVAAARERAEPTTPSTIADERATNPFVRTGEPTVAAAAKRFDPTVDPRDPVAVLAAVRAWKDGFK
jgi:hydroxyacylglutathione hydrolase